MEDFAQAHFIIIDAGGHEDVPGVVNNGVSGRALDLSKRAAVCPVQICPIKLGIGITNRNMAIYLPVPNRIIQTGEFRCDRILTY